MVTVTTLLPQGRPLTRADLEALPDDGHRYELVDGSLIVTPSPVTVHQRIVLRLGMELEHRCPAMFTVLVAPLDVVLSETTVLQPDVLVARDSELTDANLPAAPALAVEVLSSSTARADRVKKRRLYRDERVPEYWIVDLDARVIERSTPRDERVEVVADRLEWRPEGASAPLTIDVERYFNDL